jgi:hypothetical protein
MCHGVSAATRAGVVWSGVLVLTGPAQLAGNGSEVRVPGSECPAIFAWGALF